MVQGTFHSGITVSDLDPALAFDREAFGLEELWRRRYDEGYIVRITDVARTRPSRQPSSGCRATGT